MRKVSLIYLSAGARGEPANALNLATGSDEHALHQVVAETEPCPAAVEVALAGQGSAECTDATSEQADGHDAAGAPRRHRTVELRAGTCECGIAAHTS